MAALGCIAVFAVCADFCGLAAVGLLVGWAILSLEKSFYLPKLTAGAVGFIAASLQLTQWPILLAFNWGAHLGAAATSTGHIARRRVYFLLVLLLLGPGLLVNELVKKNSGRERPDDTFMFAGDSKHQDSWTSRSCKTNCSFVSGHAALGF